MTTNTGEHAARSMKQHGHGVADAEMTSVVSSASHGSQRSLPRGGPSSPELSGDEPPPSSRRRLAPLRPITVATERGLMPSSRRSSQHRIWTSEPPSSIRDLLLPMAAAFLCGSVFWLLATAKTISW